SHELRTPLTIIRGEAQVTLRLQAASVLDYEETLRSILEQSVNLSRLVDDLLLLTRAEMHQLNLEIARIRIQPLLADELAKWQKLHAVRRYTLVADQVSGTSIVMGDSPRIQQVVSNLLDNATKYSPAGHPVEVSIRSTGNFATIAVIDSGEGISAA